MARFSIWEALGAGFGLIRRAPLSVVVWGVVFYGLSMLPTVLVFAVAGQDIYESYRTVLGSPGDIAAIERLNAVSMRTQWSFGLGILTSLLAVGLVYTAIYRAVLTPEDKGFFYMKLGAAEFWQALLFACLYILFIVLMIPFVIAGAVMVGVGIATAGNSDTAVLGAMGSLIWPMAIGMLVALWLGVRLSLAGPATFADNTFRLFESWTMTRGHTLPLLGLAVLLGLMLFIGSLIFYAIVIGSAVAAVGASGFDFEAIRSFFDRPYQQVLTALTPWLIGSFVVSSIVCGAYLAIVLAPWASVYKQLNARSQVEEF